MGPSGDTVETDTMSDGDEYDAAFIGNRPVEQLPAYRDADMDLGATICERSKVLTCCIFSSVLK